MFLVRVRLLNSHMTKLHSENFLSKAGLRGTMAGNISLDIACVFPAPRLTRVCYDPAIYADNPHGEVLVLFVGPLFRYNIPSFDLLAVETDESEGSSGG